MSQTPTPTWTLEGVLSSPLLWGVICVVTTAVALSGKLDMIVARALLVIAWMMAFFAIYRFAPILSTPLILRLLLTGAASCTFGVGLYFLSAWMSVKEADATAEQLAGFGKMLESYGDALTQNPSIDADQRLKLLQEKRERLSKRELTEEQKEAFKGQELTLKTLEEAKKRHLEKKEHEKKLSELDSQRQKIEAEKENERRLQAFEVSETEFAETYAPIVEYTITYLNQRLQSISKESGEPISGDFPDNNKPSIYNSKMMKEGKIVGGQHVVRIGSNSDWEFRLSVMGVSLSAGGTWRGDPHSFVFSIKGAQASVDMMAVGRREGESFPPVIGLAFGDPSDRKRVECPLTKYEELINQAVDQLILDHYIASGPPKPTQP